MEAAKAFFQQTQDVADAPPERVFTDGHTSYPRAIKEELSAEVEHEVIPCLGNPIEPSHRGIKQRYYPTLGLALLSRPNASLKPMRRVHQFFRPRQRMAEYVSLSDRRGHFLKLVDELQAIFEAA